MPAGGRVLAAGLIACLIALGLAGAYIHDLRAKCRDLEAEAVTAWQKAKEASDMADRATDPENWLLCINGFYVRVSDLAELWQERQSAFTDSKFGAN